MSETVEVSQKSSERSEGQIFPFPGVNYASRDNIYINASTLLPEGELNLMRGKRDHAFTYFPHSEYSVVVPYRGYGTTEDSQAELKDLEPEIIQQEPMQDFYRHVYMMHRFGEIDQLAANIPTIMNRVKNESKDFAKKAYPDGDEEAASLRSRTEKDFYFLKLACLEKLNEHGVDTPPELVEELYTEAITSQPRSIHYAMMLEKTDGSESEYTPIATRIKNRLLPKLADPESMDDQSVALLKWSFGDQALQADLVRQTLTNIEDTKELEAAVDVFTDAMEVYDITTSLQEYAFTHEDFQPKVDRVLDYLTSHPVAAHVRLDAHRKEAENPREPLVGGDPAQTQFRTEEHISAGQEIRILEQSDEIDSRLKKQYELSSPESIAGELERLTPQQLEHELFQNFYAHMDMLSKFGDAETVAKFLPVIMRRGRIGVDPNSRTLPQNEFSSLRAGLPDDLKQRAYLKMMACMEVCEEDSSVRFPPAAIKDLEHAANYINPRFIRYGLVFDERNKMYGEANDWMEQKIIDRCSIHLTDTVDIQRYHKEFAQKMLPWLYVRPELYSQILIKSFNKLMGPGIKDGAIRIVQGLAPHMGVEGIRKTLREHVGSLTNEYQIKKYGEITSTIFDYMQLDLDGPVAVDLVRDVYNEVDMEGYEPNDELLTHELRLIHDETDKLRDSTVADIACGMGRHVIALNKSPNTHVTGFDLVPKHIEHIKSIQADADVHQASWYDLPAQDGQFDLAIMMGRSFAHNTTISDAVACLQEVKRVVKDEGSMIMDLPDGTKGDYKELISQTFNRARGQGIEHILPGTIIDSPDNQHYFDRYIPDPESFQALCELAGLNAQIINTRGYKGHGEEHNSNMYWKLTKRPRYEHQSIDRVAELVQIIRTNRYAMEDSAMLAQTTTS